MKKLTVFLLALFLAVPAASQAAEQENALSTASSAAQGEFQNTPRNRIEQLTGKVWLESSSDSKKAVIFGIETAIDIERMINDRMTTNAVRAGKRPSTNLSPFEIGWTKAFKDVLIADIVKAVDDWYAAHPGNENRLVMEVIWDEIVTPRLGTGKTRKPFPEYTNAS